MIRFIARILALEWKIIELIWSRVAPLIVKCRNLDSHLETCETSIEAKICR